MVREESSGKIIDILSYFFKFFSVQIIDVKVSAVIRKTDLFTIRRPIGKGIKSGSINFYLYMIKKLINLARRFKPS